MGAAHLLASTSPAHSTALTPWTGGWRAQCSPARKQVPPPQVTFRLKFIAPVNEETFPLVCALPARIPQLSAPTVPLCSGPVRGALLPWAGSQGHPRPLQLCTHLPLSLRGQPAPCSGQEPTPPGLTAAEALPCLEPTASFSGSPKKCVLSPTGSLTPGTSITGRRRSSCGVARRGPGKGLSNEGQV